MSDLTKIPALDDETGHLHAIVETPQGSHHKFDFDPELKCFQLKKTLPQGMTFPLDFGFIPSTKADDGDPIDVLVMLDFPSQIGALLKVRLIGAIQAEQKEKGKKWERNDRLIAVAAHSETLADIKFLADLRPRQLEQLIAFFEQYNALEGKQFRSVGNGDAARAGKLVKAAMKKFKK